MSSIQQGNPLEPCAFDPENGYHEWVPIFHQGTGDPNPGARYCLNCHATDAGPNGLRVSHKDSPVPKFPAATRSFRQINSHNPDDESPINQTTEREFPDVGTEPNQDEFPGEPQINPVLGPFPL